MTAEHGPGNKQRFNSCQANCILVSLVFILASIVVLFVTLSIFNNPGPMPSVTLYNVKLNAFNFSTANSTLTSNLQITIFCQNTEDYNGIHFDKIDVYAFYRSRLQIAPPTTIPGMSLGHRQVTVWYPYLNGTAVSVNPYLAASLAQDLTAGAVLINVKATGRLSYKDWFFTVHYRMEVNCPAYVTFGNKTDGNVVKDPFPGGCDTIVKV